MKADHNLKKSESNNNLLVESRRVWLRRVPQLATAIIGGRVMADRMAELAGVSVERICRHLFEHAQRLSVDNARFGRPGFDFLQGEPTRDVAKVPCLHDRYRAHLLVGSGRHLTAAGREIVQYRLAKFLHLENGFGGNEVLLAHVLHGFFGHFPDAPGLVFPMPVYPSSRYAAATLGVRVVDESPRPIGDGYNRTQQTIATTDARLHLVRFGWTKAYSDRNFQLDLRDARFAVPADQRGEKPQLSSWGRWRVGVTTANKRLSQCYQEELGYSTPDDEHLRRQAYLPSYADKIHRDTDGRTVYLDLCNLILIRLLSMGSEMQAAADIITISFDRWSGAILDLCSINSPFALYYSRNAELRALLNQHFRQHNAL